MVRLPRGWSVAALPVFFGLLIGLPLTAAAAAVQIVALFDAFCRNG